MNGDHQLALDALVANGQILIYKASADSWQTATVSNVTITYYANAEDTATANTGYTGLNNYTVLTGGDPLTEAFGSAATCANGWHDSAWFGNYWADPAAGGYWTWHESHGWTYLLVQSDTKAVMWDDATQTWWYVGKDTYPYLYNYTTQSWYYYIAGTTPERAFWSYRDNALISESEIVK